MLKNKKCSKGYIGPIGDDLPSLIPLIFALTIFFATFTNTMTQFEKKNTLLDQDLEVLKIARVMKGNGYYSSADQFQKACQLVRTNDVYFMALITPLPSPDEPYNFSIFEESGTDLVPKDLSSSSEILLFDDPLTDPKPYLCPPYEELENYRVPFSGSLFKEAKMIQRNFPIAVETENNLGFTYVQAAQLVVIVWR